MAGAGAEVGAAIRGVAMAVPDRVVSNEGIASRVGVDPEWIAKHRHLTPAVGERISDFAAPRPPRRLNGQVSMPRSLTLCWLRPRPRMRSPRSSIGADFLSRFLDLSDRSTTPLFADGAGVAVISAAGRDHGSIGPNALR